MRAALQDGQQGAEWSATALTSPAQQEAPQAVLDMSHPASPVAGVHVSDIMADIARQYDLNVDESEKFEWLLQSGVLPTIGAVFDACEAMKFPRRPPAPGQASSSWDLLAPNQTSAFGAHDPAPTHPFPPSWEDETCPAEMPEASGQFQSPPAKSAQQFFMGTTSPLLEPPDAPREPARAPRTPPSGPLNTPTSS